MAEPEQILVVEDDRDIAELLVEVLSQEGYSVVTAENAAAGLAAMRSRRFALVLTDHRMPGQTGMAMLHEAEAEGLLNGVAVLLVSADADIMGASPWRALRKPVDFDVLLDEVHGAVVGRTMHPPPAPAAADGGVIPVLKLVLYVTAASESSRRARRNLDRVLAQYDGAAVAVTLIDLSEAVDALDPEDRVAFTPTLVRRSPPPRAWLLGDLRDHTALRSLLDDAGVARRTT